MKIQDVLAKMPAGRRLKRRTSERWLKVYDDGTLRLAGNGKGPKKIEPLTTSDLTAEDWEYEHIPKLITRGDLLEVGRCLAQSATARGVSPTEVARMIADELGMD